MSALEQLPRHVENFGDDRTRFNLNEVRAVATEVHELDQNHWLALYMNDGWLEYAFYAFHDSNCEPDAPKFLTCVFRGSGPTAGLEGGLREMRHTWFSPEESDDCKGYVFYMPTKAFRAAFEILERYFDT